MLSSAVDLNAASLDCRHSWMRCSYDRASTGAGPELQAPVTAATTATMATIGQVRGCLRKHISLPVGDRLRNPAARRDRIDRRDLQKAAQCRQHRTTLVAAR